MPFGVLTPEQREAALEKAREARQMRAAMMARIRSGDVTLRDILADDLISQDPVVQKLPVRTMLRALPGIGRATADALCLRARIPENRRVRGLSENQREILLENVRTR
jgi:hypothetical protein